MGMNKLDEIQTKVFCSQCDVVTSDFIEWGDEFYCLEQCVAYLPTPEDFGDYPNADADWLASAGWGDDEDYGVW